MSPAELHSTYQGCISLLLAQSESRFFRAYFRTGQGLSLHLSENKRTSLFNAQTVRVCISYTDHLVRSS